MRAGVHKPTYASWQMMKNRCLNPRAGDYAYYGGRGITVCDEWMTFDGFLAAMGVRPDGLTLERTDGTKGYNPTNCKWASKTEQARNREYTRNVTFKGRTQKVWEWAAELGLKPMSFHWRLWSFKEGFISEAQVFVPNPRSPA